MSYGFGHDPEVPAGFQDADIEMRDLEREVELAESFGPHHPCIEGHYDCAYEDSGECSGQYPS